MISNRVKRAYLNTKDGEHQVSIAKYDDLGIDDLLEPLERLDNTTEFNAKETHDVLLCNKLCFQEGYSLYNVVDNNIKKKVVSVLTKNFGFFLKFVTSMENGQFLELLYSLVYDHADILQNHYKNIVSNTKKKPLLSEFKSIYFGSKLFNKLVEYYKCDMKNYIENLYTLYLGLARNKPSALNGELLLSIMNLSPSLAIDICFLNSDEQNFSMPSLFSSEEFFQEIFIKNIFEPTTTITKRKLIYQVGLLFDKIGSKENYHTMQYILKSINLQFLDVDKLIFNCTNEYFLTAFLNSCNTSMVKRILVSIVMKWTVLGENSGSESNDMLLTKLILQCCNILERVDFEKEFAHKTFFINGVSKRLMNPMKGFVERTMIVSKRLTNDKINFEADIKVDLLDVDLLDKELKFETLTYLSQGGMSVPLPRKMEELSITSNEIVKSELTDDVNKRIYFIKDFIKQLLSISSQSSNDLNVVEVLNEGCKIMEMKIENGNSKEIDFYMSDLLPLLISIKPRTETEEKLPIENFRIRALVSTIKSNPKTAFETLLDYLFNKDLSIQTRLSLLTSVGLGCLEINESKSLKIDEKVESEIDEMLLNDKLIKHSITTWRSKKLDKNSDNKSDLKTRYFKQQNTVETLKVCHALVNGWINGINLGPTYDKIFKEHYLKLLVFIYGIISEQKHLDANSELKNEVQKIIVDGYSQGIVLEKDLLAEMV